MLLGGAWLRDAQGALRQLIRVKFPWRRLQVPGGRLAVLGLQGWRGPSRGVLLWGSRGCGCPWLQRGLLSVDAVHGGRIVQHQASIAVLTQ